MIKEVMSRVWKISVCLLITLTLFPQHNVRVSAEEVYTYNINSNDIGTGMNQISYSGWWSTSATESWTNASKWSASNMPSFEAKFSGNRIAIIGKISKDHGIYKVQIDDLEPEEVDAYSATTKQNIKIYEKAGLDEGVHTIKFFVQDKRNLNGSGILGAQFVKLEVGSSVDNPTKVYETIVNDADEGTDFFQMQYTGTWKTSVGYPDRFYKGDEHWFNFNSYYQEGDPLPTYTMKFVGSGFELSGEKQPGLGIYNVYLDGKMIGTADAYSATRISKTTLFSKMDIPHGEHTLKVELSKTKNSASKGVDGEIDSIKIYHQKIPTTSVVFDASSLQVEKGDDIQLNAGVLPSYATNPKLIYTSNNPDVAAVDVNGKIVGVNEGKTTITVSEKGSSVFNSIEVNVLPQGVPLEAFIGSTDVHHQQKNYNDYLGSGNEFYESVAWKGDTLNSKLVVLTKKTMVNNINVVASDFSTNQGDVISKDNIKIMWLKDIEANLGRGKLSTAPNEDFPDVLYTEKPINADAKKVNSAWINIHVPKETKPGIYKGRLSLTADEMNTPILFDYEYEVLDLQLPNAKESTTQIELWQHPFVSARYYGISNLNDTNNPNWFNEEHSAYLESMMKEYASIGGRGVVATIVEEAWNHQSYDNDPSMVKWTKKIDGTFEYDYTLFDKWIELNIRSGVIDPVTKYGQIKCYSIVPWDNQVTYYDEATQKVVKVKLTPGSEAWKTQWNSLLNDFIEHVDQKGWLDITYISMDERPITQLEPAVDLIKSIESKSGKKFKISSAMNFEAISDYNFLDKIDDISIGISHIKLNDAVKKLSNHRTTKGLLTTVYNCVGDAPNSNTISMPVESNWILWYSMNQNLSGYMRWSYDGWTQKPLENVHYKYWEAGDPFFIYPGDKGSDIHFRSSPRFERLKEGIRDVNKAKYLMSLSEVYNEDIQALVDGLKRPTQGVNSWGATLLTTQVNQELVKVETRRMKDGINAISKEYIKNRIVEITDIEINNSSVDMVEGEEIVVEYTVMPKDATNKTVYFSSTDDAVVSVDSSGKITANKEGSAIVIVSSKEDTTDSSALVKEVKVTVNKAIIEITEIEIKESSFSLKIGETALIEYSLKPDNATSRRLYWWSSDKLVVSVDDGKITGVKAGSATIYVSTSDGRLKQATITKEIKINISDETTSIITPNITGGVEAKPSLGRIAPNTSSGVNTKDFTNIEMLFVLASISAFVICLKLKNKGYKL